MLMLLFHIGKELYACDSEPVMEIVPKVKIQKIPHAPHYLSGYLNFGGISIPVIDLRQLIEGESCSSAMHTRIVLVRNPDSNNPKQYIGIIVEKMTEIFEDDPNNFVDSGLKVKELPFFGGVLNHHELHVQFIEIDKFFKLLD